ncbi:radical SAM protein [Candidatus Bathyarchaeota archaeon]|nr:radical SAM protein [Candidatus Bathyarchaeota archaeon]
MVKPIVNITADSGIPLIGSVGFGLIDRGTNVVQVRPTSICPLSCIFCSTDAGPKSLRRAVEYTVELEYLIEGFRKLVEFKNCKHIEAHIDTVGDPLTYLKLPELCQALRETSNVETVSLQTHGFLLTEELVDDLEAAGLTRINLSIDSLNPDKAKMLSGTENYDVDRIVEMAKYITQSKIDLLIAPVWVPGINDDDIERIIQLALEIKAGKHAPPLGIQKMLTHKHGRKPKGVKPMSWKVFYGKLRSLENVYKVKLILSPEDFGIHKCRELPTIFRKFEKVWIEVVGLGLFKREKLGVARGRVLTIVDIDEAPVGSKIRVRVLRVKNNIYMARFEP